MQIDDATISYHSDSMNDLPDEMDFDEEVMNQDGISDKAPSSDNLRSARKLENANNAVSSVRPGVN